jgi:hypothetical protein
MFIRVTTGTFDPSREAEVQRWGEEEFIPALRRLPGFRGYYGGVDREGGRIVAISRWETREQADALRERAGEVIGTLSTLGVQIEPGQVFTETLADLP